MTSASTVGDSEAEIEMADRAVALNPNSWSTWSCRGQVYRIAGLPEEAIRKLRTRHSHEPGRPATTLYAYWHWDGPY